MNRVVISGYYGFNNIGDESILTAIISNIRDNVNDIEITVLSKDPELTRRNHNVKSVNRKNMFKVIPAILKCDLLLSGGGSLLQDVTSSRSIVYYLSVIFLGILFRKKVMIYSQGIGPINKSFNKTLTKYVLNKVDFITLRDEKSLKVLKDMNVNNKNIDVTADPVIGLKKGDTGLGYKILKDSGLEDGNKPLIGFTLRGRNKVEGLVSIIARTSDRIINELGVNVAFIPFHNGEDIEIIEELQSKMKNQAICLKGKYDINEMLGIIGNLDLLVGVRLHSLVFGAVMNVPMIAISYDPKIDNFMQYLDENIFSNIENIDEEKLFEEIKSIINNHGEYNLQLYEKVEYLKDKLHKNEEILVELLNDK